MADGAGVERRDAVARRDTRTENPRVVGSIPTLATNQINRLARSLTIWSGRGAHLVPIYFAEVPVIAVNRRIVCADWPTEDLTNVDR